MPEQSPNPDYFLVGDQGSELLVLQQAGAGLWGTIYALVGFNAQRTALTGFAIRGHNETPGLGARMEEPWFRNQFAGKSGPFTTINDEPKDKQTGGSTGNNEMDAITGATVTTRAVQVMLNQSLLAVEDLAEGTL